MTRRLTLRLAMALLTLHVNVGWGQSGISFVPTAKIDESSLSLLMSNPIIQSFDLASDGKTVALLVITGTKVGAPLWLVVEDIATKHAIVSHELGASVFPAGGFTPQVLFASDQRHLIVQDLRTIRVFDSKSLELRRTISPSSGNESQTPLFVIGASNKDIFVCAFGTQQKFNPRFHTTPVRVEIVDISSGELLGEWASADVPQSISPNGDLIAVSSSQARQGVLPVNVFDVHGQKVAELTSGFSFSKEADQSKPLGRIIGLFVGSQELLLSPDENIDQAGNHSGGSLQLVSVIRKQVQVEQTIIPRHFASTSEMAVSADHKSVVVISWYVPPSALAHEGILPASSPEMLVFRRGASMEIEATLSIQGSGLKVSGWLENRRPRLSSDGSVIAVAQKGGVMVFKKSPPP
jgi:hypothetical protein